MHDGGSEESASVGYGRGHHGELYGSGHHISLTYGNGNGFAILQVPAVIAALPLGGRDEAGEFLG